MVKLRPQVGTEGIEGNCDTHTVKIDNQSNGIVSDNNNTIVKEEGGLMTMKAEEHSNNLDDDCATPLSNVKQKEVVSNNLDEHVPSPSVPSLAQEIKEEEAVVKCLQEETDSKILVPEASPSVNEVQNNSPAPASRDEFFGNNLIWRHLLPYLSFSDLKETRLVCKNFNDKVLIESSFINDSVVHLTVARLNPYVFGTTKINWRNFKIVLAAPESNEEGEEEGEDIDLNTEDDEDEEEDDEYFVDKCLEVSVEEEGEEDDTVKHNKRERSEDEDDLLQNKNKRIKLDDDEDSEWNFDWLYPKLQFTESFIITVGADDDSGYLLYPPLGKLLESTTRLRKLALDTLIVTEDPSHIFGSEILSDKAQRTLEYLQEFQIFVHDSAEVLKPLSSHTASMLHGPDGNFVKFTDFLIPHMKNLKVIRVAELVDETEYNLENFQVHEGLQLVQQNIHKLIDNNKMNLIVLELTDLQLCSTSSNEQLHCLFKKSFPALKSLTIRASHNETDNIVTFLRALPFLQEFDMTLFHDLPTNLWKTIRERSEDMKRLRVKTRCFSAPGENLWSFMIESKNLKDVDIAFLKPETFSQNSGSMKTIFSQFPSCIQKISLNSFPPCGILNPGDFTTLMPSTLTQLKLAKCEGSVNDGTIEFICKNLIRLQVLEISGNSHVTDFGFTGIHPVDPGLQLAPFSLNNLKGLRELVLKRCISITNLTCFLAISFPELIFLDIFGNTGITKDGALEIVKNNPCLETLRSSNIAGMPYTHEITETLNPRFKRHIISYRDDDTASFMSTNPSSANSDDGDSDDMNDDDFGEEEVDVEDDDPQFSNDDEDPVEVEIEDEPVFSDNEEEYDRLVELPGEEEEIDADLEFSNEEDDEESVDDVNEFEPASDEEEYGIDFNDGGDWVSNDYDEDEDGDDEFDQYDGYPEDDF